MNRFILLGVATLVSFGLTPAQAGSLLFATDPSSGALTGAPGATVGFGYTLTNTDSTLWALTTNLAAGTFQFATETDLFDFPEVAPGQTIFVPWNHIAGAGLYEVAIDPASPVPFVNSGAFVLSFDWYTGDPFGGGVLSSSGTDQLAGYQVTAAATSSAPEVNTLSAALSSLLVLLFVRRRKGVTMAGTKQNYLQ